MSGISDGHKSRLANLQAWKEAGLNPYGNNVRVTDHAQNLQERYADLENGEETSKRVTVAGRIMAVRNSGMFIDLQDHTGRIQIFSHKKNLGEDDIQKVKRFDVGDIITVTGVIRRTDRGELTVDIAETCLLTKSLQVPPDKHHGLTDVEERYRKRHIDFTFNAASKAVLLKRSQIIANIRETMVSMGFLEVETPMMHLVPGGAQRPNLFRPITMPLTRTCS